MDIVKYNEIGASKLIQAVIQNAVTVRPRDSKRRNVLREFVKSKLVQHYCDVFDLDETRVRAAILKNANN